VKSEHDDTDMRKLVEKLKGLIRCDELIIHALQLMYVVLGIVVVCLSSVRPSRMYCGYISGARYGLGCYFDH